MAHPLRSVARAALGGLVLGLIGASLILLFISLKHLSYECPLPGTEECNFDLINAQELGRLQSFAAIGCALIGGGLALALRRR